VPSVVFQVRSGVTDPLVPLDGLFQRVDSPDSLFSKAIWRFESAIDLSVVSSAAGKDAATASFCSCVDIIVHADRAARLEAASTTLAESKFL